MIFGDYYAYDTGYAVKNLLRNDFPELSKTEFKYLFDTFNAVYDTPNIFLPLIGGVLALRVRFNDYIFLYFHDSVFFY